MILLIYKEYSLNKCVCFIESNTACVKKFFKEQEIATSVLNNSVFALSTWKGFMEAAGDSRSLKIVTTKRN
jgi:hypothetical protein